LPLPYTIDDVAYGAEEDPVDVASALVVVPYIMEEDVSEAIESDVESAIAVLAVLVVIA
jgi:hypothetical protein